MYGDFLAALLPFLLADNPVFGDFTKSRMPPRPPADGHAPWGQHQWVTDGKVLLRSDQPALHRGHWLHREAFESAFGPLLDDSEAESVVPGLLTPHVGSSVEIVFSGQTVRLDHEYVLYFYLGKSFGLRPKGKGFLVYIYNDGTMDELIAVVTTYPRGH